MEQEIKNTIDEIANTLIKSLSTIKNSPLMKDHKVMPVNALNGKDFKGINATMLVHSEYSDPRFISDKNAQKIGLDVKENEKPTTLMSWQFSDKNGQRLSEPKLIFSDFYNIDQFSNAESLKNDTKGLIESKPEIDIDNFNDVFNPQVDLTAFNQENASYKSDVIHEHSKTYIENVLKNSNYPLIPELIDILSQDLSTKIHSEFGVTDSKTDAQKKSYFSSINTATSDAGVLSSKIDSEELISFYSAVFNSIEDNLEYMKNSRESSNLSLAERNYLNTVKEYIQVEDLGELSVFTQRMSDNSLDIIIDGYTQGMDSQWSFTIQNDQMLSFVQNNAESKNLEDLKAETFIDKKNAKENVLSDGMNAIRDNIQESKTRHYIDLMKDNPNSFKSSTEKAKSLNAKFDKDNKSWYVRGKDLDNFQAEWNKFISNKQENNVKKNDTENLYFDVPFVNRNQAKELGAKWDAKNKLWFTENSDDNKEVISNLSNVFKKIPPENLENRREVMNNISKNNTEQTSKEVPLSGQNEKSNRLQFKTIIENKENSPENLEDLYKSKVFILAKDTSEKKEAMQNGFSFNTKEDLWYTEELTKDQTLFISETNFPYASEKQLNEIANKQTMAEEKIEETNVKKIFLEVDFKNKDAAKELGAKWDKANSSWYSLDSNPNIDSLKEKFSIKTDNEVEEKKQEIENKRVYLNVPKEEKDAAKELGARWDNQKFSWYSMKDNKNLDALLDKWSKDVIQGIDNDHVDKSIQSATIPTKDDKKIFLDVDFKNKDTAKELGAKWDKANNSWFTMESDPNSKDLLDKFKEVSYQKVQDNIKERDNNRVYLNVPKEEKDAAKKLGARWDNQKFSWYSMKDNKNLDALLDKWEIKPISEENNKELEEQHAQEERTYLHVHYDNRAIAKDLGATYDPALTQWYWDNAKGEIPEQLEKYINKEVEEPTADPIQRFKDFLTIEHDFNFDAGELPIPDGKPHRVSLDSDTGNKQSGYYILHDNGGGMFAGVYQNFKKHKDEEKWLSGKPNTNEYSESEMLDIKKKIEANAKKMKAEAKERLQIMKERAEYGISNFLEKSQTATEYTLKKEIPVYPTSYTVKDDSVNSSIKAFGSKGNEYDYLFQKDDLIIPLQDIKGNVVSMQNIKPNGDKYLLGGGEKRGAFHIINASMENFKNADIVIITEGYATGATVEQAKNEVLSDKDNLSIVTIAAMDAHNISTVVKAIKESQPEKSIIIAADNDFGHEFEKPPKPNLGITNAEEAAKSFADVVVIYPEFKTTPDGTDISKLVQEAKIEAGKNLSDFNDQSTKYKNGKTLVAKEVKSGISQIVRIKNKIKDAKDELLLEDNIEQKEEKKENNKKSAGRKM